MASMLVACEETIGEASLIAGAWELLTLESDGNVYADLTGASHYEAKPVTHTYENKEEVWLFYENSISRWAQFKDGNETHWSGYMDDARHVYVVEGTGQAMQIIETSTSIIPGMEEKAYVTRYHVEKLSNSKMVLSSTATPYISDSASTVEVHLRYTFKRENTLLNYIKQVFQ